ncbi:Uncharacterized protein HZ326_2459 [Fusarium oxysporum f. sp. albedinis]|nr:Uncharacterized protein HZ326_2459 [Fusarium oxysporum f. sp. albedinis]
MKHVTRLGELKDTCCIVSSDETSSYWARGITDRIFEMMRHDNVHPEVQYSNSMCVGFSSLFSLPIPAERRWHGPALRIHFCSGLLAHLPFQYRRNILFV